LKSQNIKKLNIFEYFIPSLQVFSCISRKLNTNNAFSLPKMQKLCDAAFTQSCGKKLKIEHILVENNLNWKDYVEPLCISKAQ